MGSAYPSSSPSGLQPPPDGERRRIHFNSEVAQCIAVETMEGDDDEYLRSDDDDHNDDGESSNDSLMMKEIPRKAKTSNRSKLQQ